MRGSIFPNATKPIHGHIFDTLGQMSLQYLRWTRPPAENENDTKLDAFIIIEKNQKKNRRKLLTGVPLL